MVFDPKAWESGPAVDLAPFTLRPYSLPLTKPYVWAKGRHLSRSGIIVACNLDGHLGYGEVAPAPHVVLDTASYFAECKEVLQSFDPLKEDLALRLNKAAPCPRLRCGLVSAWLSAKAAAQKISLAANLGKIFGQVPLTQVTVNALITSEDPAGCSREAARLSEQGFGSIKIKLLGRERLDLDRVHAIRESSPRERLRLDANGCWPESKILERLSAFEEFNIEYVEDPAPSSASIEILKKIRSESPIKIAIDEGADTLASIEKLLRAKVLDVLILKTQRLGGPDLAIKAAYLAREHQVPCVLTASLESAVGLTVALHTASLFPSPLLPCGIGTADYFKSNVAPFPNIYGGELNVPNGPGLGFV